MGAESALIELGLIQREASDFGGTLTRGNDDYPCSIGTLGMGARLVAGGFSPNAEMTVTIRKAVLPDDFIDWQTGETLTITDRSGTVHPLKIAQEGIRDCIYAWELTLDSQNQNA